MNARTTVAPYASRALVGGAFAALALVASACGGPKAPESATSLADEPEPTTVEEAEARIARARADLGLADARAEERPASGASAAPAEPAQAPASAAPADERSEARTAEREDDGRAARCVSACRARASMARAADALCRLAGDADVRCTRARSSVAEADAAVTAAACGC